MLMMVVGDGSDGWTLCLDCFVAFLIIFFSFSDLQAAALERMKKKRAILIGTGCKTRL